MKTRLSQVEEELAATKMQVAHGTALLIASQAEASSKGDQIRHLMQEKRTWQAFAMVAIKVNPEAMQTMLAANSHPD